MAPVDLLKQQRMLATYSLFHYYSCVLEAPWPLLFSRPSFPALSLSLLTLNNLLINCLLSNWSKFLLLAIQRNLTDTTFIMWLICGVIPLADAIL